MMSALKIESIYNKIHMIEQIVDKCTNAGQVLTLDQLQEFALNLGALQMVNFLLAAYGLNTSSDVEQNQFTHGFSAERTSQAI